MDTWAVVPVIEIYAEKIPQHTPKYRRIKPKQTIIPTR